MARQHAPFPKVWVLCSRISAFIYNTSLSSPRLDDKQDEQQLVAVSSTVCPTNISTVQTYGWTAVLEVPGPSCSHSSDSTQGFSPGLIYVNSN